jgi:hypothetical protein
MRFEANAVLTTNKVAGCPGLKAPVPCFVFYQAKEGYSCSDHVSYAVANAEGKVQVLMSPSMSRRHPPGARQHRRRAIRCEAGFLQVWPGALQKLRGGTH